MYHVPRSVASTAGGSERDELAKIPITAQLDRLMFNVFGFVEDISSNSTSEDSTVMNLQAAISAAGRHVFACHGISETFDIDQASLGRFLHAVSQVGGSRIFVHLRDEFFSMPNTSIPFLPIFKHRGFRLILLVVPVANGDFFKR